MYNNVVTLRLSQKHAAFLQTILSVLATTTRQAMNRPGMESERRTALGNRAFLLETIEDAVHGALLEAPQAERKAAATPRARQIPQPVSRLSAA